MSTIKINGGGILQGKVFYGTNHGSSWEGTISIELDEDPFDAENSPTYQGDRIFLFSTTTGYLVAGGGESDLLQVDPSELGKTWF